MEPPFERVEGLDGEVEPQAEAPPGPLPGPSDAAAVAAVPVEAPGVVTRLLGLRRGEVRVATAAGIWANHFEWPHGLAQTQSPWTQSYSPTPHSPPSLCFQALLTSQQARERNRRCVCPRHQARQRVVSTPD
jgi:hypothetical protein